MAEPTKPIQQFAHLLRTEGLWAGLRYLNSTTDYRFTGVYRFAGSTLANIALVDREDTAVRCAPDVDQSVSYCSLMRETGEPLSIADAPRDTRVENHPSRDFVRAYCGIPLIDEGGNVIGSVCHFALEPTLLYDENLELLLQVPAALACANVDLEAVNP